MTGCRYFPYTLTLKSPAVITALGGDPNSSSTLAYIPGAAVRGAVARALGDPGADTAGQKEFQELIFGGKVRYLNAYPSLDGLRSLPVPLSLRRKKNDAPADRRVYAVDLAAFDGRPAPGKEPNECWPEEQLAPLKQGFLTIGAAQPVLLQPKMNARIHHQRDREKGRAWKDRVGTTHGAIFAFESLDAGQSFQGLIQVRGGTDKELERTVRLLKALLGDTILVGRSRRAGYGGMAALQWGEGRTREVDGVGRDGLRPVGADIPRGIRFRLLLTSACIARNANTGQIDPAALPDLIEGRFCGRAKLLRTRWSFTPIGGFNRKWRLELPQTLAVSAGSVFLLEANQNIPVGQLYAVENEGLGERREEGYGRVLFLDAPLPSISLQEHKEAASFPAGDGQPPPLVSDIEKRIVWGRIARKIEEKVAAITLSARNLPANSLIGRLRTPLRGNPEEAIGTLKRWLRDGSETERLKKPAMDQLESCRMDGHQNLTDWMLKATEPDRVLSWLDADVLAQRGHIVSEQSAKQSLEKRSVEISVKLIDAVLAALAVRNKTEEAGDEC